ncbi:PAS domain S-box protein [bacterium]|nr:PAS domain S-box protein [bacterium]
MSAATLEGDVNPPGNPLDGELGSPKGIRLGEVPIGEGSLPLELPGQILQSFEFAVVATDAQGQISYWNKAAEELYGYSPAEAIGRSLDFVVPEADRRDLLRLIGGLRRGRDMQITHALHRHKDGSLIETSATFKALLDEQGELLGIVATASDASKQRRLNERLLLAFESSPSGMVMVDDKGTILMLNAETERLFGYKRQELLGRKVDILVPDRFTDLHQHHRASFARNHTRRLMGGGRELYGRRQDGSEFPVEIGLTPVETRDGLLVLGVIADISGRKLAEERFRIALESAPCGIVMVDHSGKIILINLETERLFGYSRSELIGRAIEDLIPQRYRKEHVSLRDGFARQPEARVMGSGRDLFGLRKDGSEFPVEVGLNPIMGPDGPAVLCAILDITERNQTAELLRIHAEELQRSNNDLEQFAYVASHDLQEPLRMVASYVELLAERYQGQLDERADKYIHYAVDGARRMKQLVSDLLSFSRVGTQGKPLQPLETEQVLRGVLFELRQLAEENEAEIMVGPLPRVMADETQLRQLFQNLLSNALKFRSDAPPKITITAFRSVSEVTISLSDNGVGIDMAYAERVFQMFQRLHERGKYEGSGIGLAIAKRIVERHGGRIWLESQPGQGCTFHFTLRAAAPPEAL